MLASRNQTDEGWIPEIPESDGFLLLAEPHCQARIALYQAIIHCDEMPELLRSMQVDKGLSSLMDSGETYPPALALARADMLVVFEDREPTPGEFLSTYKRVLKYHLSRQQEDGFSLTEALFDEYGNRVAGSFVWARRCVDNADQVEWVTPGYYLRRHPACHFRVD